jgi:hypothetical protein
MQNLLNKNPNVVAAPIVIQDSEAIWKNKTKYIIEMKIIP